MTTGKERLAKDLNIMEQMAAGMEDYLGQEEIFGQLINDDELQPTIGGFLVRQHRLLALADSLLDSRERLHLQEVVQKFEEAATTQPNRFKVKAQREVEARLRQWCKALQDLFEDESPSIAYYRSDVQIRAIVAALSGRLTSLPSAVAQKIEAVDDLLRQHWQSGEFIWPPEWKPAYPASDYWWLYGRLK